MAGAARTPKSPRRDSASGLLWDRSADGLGGYPRWHSTARGTKLGNPGLDTTWRRAAAAARRAQADRQAARVLPVILSVQYAGARTLQAVANALNARGVVHRDLIIALSVVTRLSLLTRSRRARPHRLRDVRGQSLSGGISIWGDWSPIIGGFIHFAPNWPLYC